MSFLYFKSFKEGDSEQVSTRTQDKNYNVRSEKTDSYKGYDFVGKPTYTGNLKYHFQFTVEPLYFI